MTKSEEEVLNIESLGYELTGRSLGPLAYGFMKKDDEDSEELGRLRIWIAPELGQVRYWRRDVKEVVKSFKPVSNAEELLRVLNAIEVLN